MFGITMWQLANVVYKIKCECGAVYIGQTGRCLLERKKEHVRKVKRCIRKRNQEGTTGAENIASSAVALHFSSARTNCRIKNAEWKILKIVHSRNDRLKREREFIRQYKRRSYNVMNLELVPGS